MWSQVALLAFSSCSLLSSISPLFLTQQSNHSSRCKDLRALPSLHALLIATSKAISSLS